MPEISLAPGESKKIVSQPARDSEYNIDVSNADVYLSHNSRAVKREGKRARPGDRVTLTNLRGKSVYAKNPNENTADVTLDVAKAGFAISFGPRAVVGAVDTGRDDDDAPAASDDYSNFKDSADLANGNITASLTPPGRSEQVAMRAVGSAAFELTLDYGATTLTFSSDANDIVDQVVPVYFADDEIGVTITDTSGGANQTDVDMMVI